MVELGGGGMRPPARDFAKLTALPGGRQLLFCGLDGGEKRLDDAWLFDTATCALCRFVHPAQKSFLELMVVEQQHEVCLFGTTTCMLGL